MNRRRFIHTTALAIAGTGVSCAAVRKSPTALAPFDREMEAFMAARKIPGGALAVSRNGRLVYARGYGWADREKKIPVTPDSLFRIASVSKPITAVAVMKLIESGKLKLDDRAFSILNIQPAVMSFRDPEPRLRKITVRQLLQHTGGWDRDKTFDPMFRPVRIAKDNHAPQPASAREVIRYMLSRPLAFDPGARYAYSNYGYCALGRLIEQVSGMSYEAFVQKEVLAPAGIKRMRIGATLDGQQARGEARYYTVKDELVPNVFQGGPERVPEPYGGFYLEAMDAHGGWIASAVDLLRFSNSLELSSPRPLLKSESLQAMFAPPPAPVSRKADGSIEEIYYGCGWSVRPVGSQGKANYWHSGSLPGTSSLLVRLANGLSWAVLFNQRSEYDQLPDRDIDAAMHRAADSIKDWPTGEAL